MSENHEFHKATDVVKHMMTVHPEYRRALSIAVSAMAHRTSIKAVNINQQEYNFETQGSTDWFCPKCESKVWPRQHYCSECGQKMRWSLQ